MTPFAVFLIAAAGIMTPIVAAAQTGTYDGAYEYAASGWRGTMRVSTGSGGDTFFSLSTNKDRTRCALFGEGKLTGNSITLREPNGGATVIIRFFEDNSEVETSGSTASFCDAGAQIAGIYLQTAERVIFERDDIRAAQNQLNKLGYDAGGADGVMGQRTRAALSGFQRQAQLQETGALSLETLYRLQQRVGAATANAASGTLVASPQAPAAPAQPPAQPTAIRWLDTVPRTLIPTLDRLYGNDLPAAIDWTNPPFDVALVDFDERPRRGANQEEILVFWNDRAFCTGDGCTLELLRWDGDGYEPVFQTVTSDVALGDGYVQGMRPLVIGGNRWAWNGQRFARDVYKPVRVR